MKKIVKCFSVLALSACTGFASYGKAVDENTAKTIGSNFLIRADVTGVNGPSDLITSYVATQQANGGTVTDYYVFNVAGGKGFVMVAGDDNIIPILAYSNESLFDIKTISPEAKYWIDGYQNQITAVIANSVPAQEGTADRWSQLMVSGRRSAAKTTTVSPLLGTLAWDQAPLYNNDCPGGSVTGCVATAMAQVMKFWNWPTVGSGYHSYRQTNLAYPTQSADFGNTTYNWSSMPNMSSNTNVALLMYHCGVATNMNYSTTESGTWVISLESQYVNCAEYALKTYFHYKRSTLRGIPRAGESGTWPLDPIISPMLTSAWISMLQTELNAGRPVLYSGAGSDGGHCWVCDGWNSTSGVMFHFNFGWSGLSNGYYTVDAIAPPSLGTGGGGSGNNFNADQCAIIGIQPDSFANLGGQIQMNSNLDCKTNSPTTYIPSFTCTATIMNSGTSSFTGDICAQVFDTNFAYVGTIQTMTSQTIAAGASTSSLSFTPASSMYQMIPAPYNIRIMYRAKGTTAWTPVANNGTFYNENLIDVRNNPDSVELGSTISYSTTSDTLRQNSALTVKAKIQNLSNGDFNGSVQAVLTNVTTGATEVIQLVKPTSIYLGSTVLYTFASSKVTSAPGTYTLSIQHQPGSTGTFRVTGSDFYENPIMYYIIGAAGVTTPAFADKINVYPNPANDVINIALNGASVDQVRITDIQGHEVQTLIPGNQSVLTVQLSNYARGIYFVNLFSGQDVVTKKIVVAK